MNLKEIYDLQKSNNKLNNLNYRLELLKKLRDVLKNNQSILCESLIQDLNKSEFESYMSELSHVYNEINYFLKNLKKLAKRKNIKTPFVLFKSKSQVCYFPKGITLLISPWNYPLFLTFLPLIGNIAAGNKSILKLSEHSRFVSKTIYNLLSTNFLQEDIFVLEADYDNYEELYSFNYDHIFYTGSERTGRLVYQEAAKHLTPVTLELGGTCPAIFFDDCNISLSCKRLVLGKMLNSGQTCVSPNYVLVDNKIKDKVIKELIFWYESFYPNDINDSYYPKIINSTAYNRLINLLENENIIYSKNQDIFKQKLSLTLVDIKDKNHRFFKEELFGPILGIYGFSNIENIINVVSNPLAIYVFTNKKENYQKIMPLSAGAIILNDTVSNLANINLPFKGVRTSGIGMYRGKYTFYELSNLKVLYRRSNRFDISLRYPPFTEKKFKKLKKFL